jgi:DNA-binding MarR family transcriptional regulator
MNLIDLPQYFPYCLSVLEQRVSQRVAQHYQQRFNLGRVEWRVMATLAIHDAMTASEICQFTRLDKMPVSRAISRLRQARLILLKQSKTDKRTSLLSLSAKGKKMYQQITPAVLQEEQEILSLLTPNERKQLKKIICKLEKGLNSIV